MLFMNRRIFFTITIILYASIIKAQDINFSQFYELPLLRNPALAGIYKGDIRATAALRTQWASVTVPYISQALGTEMKFNVSKNSNNYLSLGLQMTNDVAGDSKLGKTQFLPLIAFHKLISSEKDMYLSLGFMGGLVQQRFDPTKLKFDDQFVNGAYSSTNPTQQTFSNTEFTYGDGSVGLTFSSTFGNDINYYLGAAYFHFTRPKVAFNKQNDIILNSKYVINAGLSAPTSDYDKFILYADYFTQGGNSQAQGGIIYKHDLVQLDDDAVSISGGMFLRWNDAIIPLIKLDYYKLGIGLSYDVNISKLHSASHMKGGFEFTLSYKNFLNIKSSSANKTRCPVSVN
jgi:type IX secretion system PorP/SprF family membrane protein